MPKKGRELWTILEERSIPEPNTGCLLWLGATSSGYAMIMFHNRLFSVPRLILGLGPGEVACHRCDQRACIEPKHLYVGSQMDNLIDALTRSRLTRGKKGRWERG